MKAALTAAARKNPNGSVAIGATPVGIVVAWFLGNVVHVDVSAEVGAAITGCLIALVLFVGKYGIVGIWNRILHGDGTP